MSDKLIPKNFLTRLLAIAAIVCLLSAVFSSFIFETSPVYAATNTWDFSSAGDYTLSSSYIEITGGYAQLQHIPYVSDANTKGLWHLDEASGNLQDSAANPNNDQLEPQGSPVYSVAGPNSHYGTAIEFNDNNSYFRSVNQDPAELEFSAGQSATIEAWIYLLAAPNEEYIIGKWRTGGNRRSYKLSIDSSNKLNFSLSSNGTNVTTATSASSISVGVWTHIAGVLDNPNNTMQTYINGVADGNAVTYNSNVSDKNSRFTIARGHDGSDYLNGRVDEVRVSGVARTKFFNYSTSNPSVRPNTSNYVVYSALSGFSAAESLDGGTITYRITNQGEQTDPTWYYWNGSNWAISSGVVQTNSASVINANIASFVSQIGTGNFSFQAYLQTATGSNFVRLDSVSLTYTVADVLTLTINDSYDRDGTHHTSAPFDSNFGSVNPPDSPYYIGEPPSAAPYAIQLNVKSSSNWSLNIKGPPSGNFTSGANNIPISRLRWEIDGTGSWNTLTTSDVQVSSGGPNLPAGTDANISYELTVDWTDEPALGYSGVITYTLVAT